VSVIVYNLLSKLKQQPLIVGHPTDFPTKIFLHRYTPHSQPSLVIEIFLCGQGAP